MIAAPHLAVDALGLSASRTVASHVCGVRRSEYHTYTVVHSVQVHTLEPPGRAAIARSIGINRVRIIYNSGYHSTYYRIWGVVTHNVITLHYITIYHVWDALARLY